MEYLIKHLQMLKGRFYDVLHKLYMSIMKGREKIHIKAGSVMMTVFAALLGVAVVGGTIFYYNYRKAGYAVSYGGKFLGYVRDKNLASDAILAVEEDVKSKDDTIHIDDKASFEKVLVNSEKLTAVSAIGDEVKSDLYIKFTAYSITINGVEKAVVSTQDEANQVIEGVKNYFRDQEAKNGSEVVSVAIKDEIKVDSRISSASRKMDVKSAVNALVGIKGETNNSVQALAQNTSSGSQSLNVEITSHITDTEQVAFGTEYTTDSSLYKGQSKTVRDGEYGLKQTVSEVTKVNGVEVKKTVVNTGVVKQPITKLVARGTKDIVGSGSFIWPASGHVTSGFGYRADGYHSGMDICAPQGTPIYAADGGTVIQAGWYYGYGNLVIIDHKNGYTTYYGHCSEIYVSKGQSVTRGQNIAAIGHTGDASANHVHFEVRLNGAARNPAYYLK